MHWSSSVRTFSLIKVLEVSNYMDELLLSTEWPVHSFIKALKFLYESKNPMKPNTETVMAILKSAQGSMQMSVVCSLP